MVVLAYTSAFSTLVWTTKHTCGLLKYTWLSRRLSFHFEQVWVQSMLTRLRYWRDGQTDRQTDGFLALYSTLHYKYYLNSTTSRLSLLLHESKVKPRTSFNNNDNLRVQWDLSGFYPMLLMCTTIASVHRLPLFFEVIYNLL